MLYLYYNKRYDAWSEITRMSYHLKLLAPRREMNEGDKVLSLPRAVAQRLAVLTPKRTRARRAKSTQKV